MTDKRPAFQFYQQDFLSDINVISMNPSQRGIYITLLSVCWIQGKIPSDSKTIAKLFGCHSIDMAELDFVISTFKKHPKRKGFLIHPRLELERAKQDANRIKRVKAGKDGAEKRWHGKDLDGKTIAKDSLSSSSSSSSSSSTSLKPIKDYVLFFLEDWESYPKKGNKQRAKASYLKSVTTPEKRKAFQDKTRDYIESVDDPHYLKNGDTWFFQWEGYEVGGVIQKKAPKSFEELRQEKYDREMQILIDEDNAKRGIVK